MTLASCTLHPEQRHHPLEDELPLTSRPRGKGRSGSGPGKKVAGAGLESPSDLEAGDPRGPGPGRVREGLYIAF
jgi:hypothetical protein